MEGEGISTKVPPRWRKGRVMFSAYFLRVLGRFCLVSGDRSEALCLMMSHGDK